MKRSVLLGSVGSLVLIAVSGWGMDELSLETGSQESSDVLIGRKSLGSDLVYDQIVFKCSKNGSDEVRVLVSRIKKLGQEERWEDLLSVLDSIYTRPPKAFTERVWLALDAVYLLTRLKLFEKEYMKEDRSSELGKLNPCYAFGSSDKVLLQHLLWKEKPIQGEGILETAGVYLYALGRYLDGDRNPQAFSLIYRKAFRLVVDQCPPNSPLLWAISKASKDRETQDLVAQFHPRPSFL